MVRRVPGDEVMAGPRPSLGFPPICVLSMGTRCWFVLASGLKAVLFLSDEAAAVSLGVTELVKFTGYVWPMGRPSLAWDALAPGGPSFTQDQGLRVTLFSAPGPLGSGFPWPVPGKCLAVPERGR